MIRAGCCFLEGERRRRHGNAPSRLVQKYRWRRLPVTRSASRARMSIEDRPRVRRNTVEREGDATRGTRSTTSTAIENSRFRARVAMIALERLPNTLAAIPRPRDLRRRAEAGDRIVRVGQGVNTDADADSVRLSLADGGLPGSAPKDS